MGTKMQDLLDKRCCGIESICQTIIQGMKDANVYETLVKDNFTVKDIASNAMRIDSKYPRGTGGVYLRWHLSGSEVVHWKPNTTYAYVGKTMDFHDCCISHARIRSWYGDLNQNSQRLVMSALCVMSEQDNIDFAFLVEQIFVCLLQSYHSDLCVDSSSIILSNATLDHIEAVEAASYFRAISEQVFKKTGFLAAVERSEFGAAHGANYSMPFIEWAQFSEQILFIHHDTRIKDKENGESIPMAVLRSAKPKLVHYHMDSNGEDRMCVYKKNHEREQFFSIQLLDKSVDGTTAPRQGAPYHVVFEVRTDGKPHAQAWSRIQDIGPFLNWDQGRSLAVRLECEYPPNSGTWRTKYIQTRTAYKFLDNSIAGSNVNFAKTISMIQWLFDAKPNHSHNWITRLRVSAHVLQAFYNYNTQTIQIKNQAPIVMHRGGMRTMANVISHMSDPKLGLLNLNGAFGKFKVAPDASIARKRKLCDTCSMLRERTLKEMGLKCVPLTSSSTCCQVCRQFGRPCCSWTAIGAVRRARNFSVEFIADTSTEIKVTSEDVANYQKLRAALIVQPL